MEIARKDNFLEWFFELFLEVVGVFVVLFCFFPLPKCSCFSL